MGWDALAWMACMSSCHWRRDEGQKKFTGELTRWLAQKMQSKQACKCLSIRSDLHNFRPYRSLGRPGLPRLVLWFFSSQHQNSKSRFIPSSGWKSMAEGGENELETGRGDGCYLQAQAFPPLADLPFGYEKGR